MVTDTHHSLQSIVKFSPSLYATPAWKQGQLSFKTQVFPSFTSPGLQTQPSLQVVVLQVGVRLSLFSQVMGQSDTQVEYT